MTPLAPPALLGGATPFGPFAPPIGGG